MSIAGLPPITGSESARLLRAAFEPLLADLPTGPPVLLSASVPVAPPDPLALFASARGAGEEPALFLQPAEDLALVTIGCAWSVEAEGPGRFDAVAQAWAACCEDARLAPDGRSRAVGPILLGGFGFAPDAASSPTWRGFERASFRLPALLVTVISEGAWLTLSVVADPGAWDSSQVDVAIERWDRLLADGSADRPGSAEAALRPIDMSPDSDAWRDSVARLAGAVGRGRIDKAVLSRQVRVAASEAIDVPAVLRRLAADAPEATTFAVTRGTRTFLGATPERLVRLEGRALRTMAMAGSTRRTGDAAPDASRAVALLGSDKEREEHDVVVRMLREVLEPITSRLDVAAGPAVMPLNHVQHLLTPLSGELLEAGNVLELAGRLHPTPAVAGAPRELALELIGEEEAHERGWYAGPLGWVDRSGDGDLVVALRSGVVEGREASLFAGCGIMADSDPDREWDESAAKLLALGTALGRWEP